MLHAVRLIARFDDVALVRRPIQQRSGHLGVTKYTRPFREAKVGGDHDAGGLIQPCAFASDRSSKSAIDTVSASFLSEKMRCHHKGLVCITSINFTDKSKKRKPALKSLE